MMQRFRQVLRLNTIEAVENGYVNGHPQKAPLNCMRIILILLFCGACLCCQAQSYAFFKSDIGVGQNQTKVKDIKEMLVVPLVGAKGFSVPASLQFGYRHGRFALSSGLRYRSLQLGYYYLDNADSHILPTVFSVTSQSAWSASVPIKLEYHRPLYVLKSLEVVFGLHGEISNHQLKESRTHEIGSASGRDFLNLVLVDLEEAEGPGYAAGLSIGLVNAFSDLGSVGFELRYLHGLNNAYSGSAEFYDALTDSDVQFIIDHPKQKVYVPDERFEVSATSGYLALNLVFQYRLSGKKETTK